MNDHITSPEDLRIDLHFQQVLGELRGRDVRALSPSQRATREDLIGALDSYARRGVFPRNRDFPKAMTPYFVDAVGTRCAVAHLVEHAGGHALVREIALRDNNARIAELARDADLGPQLGAWLARVGLDAAEAARIQPGYCFMTVAQCICGSDVSAFVQVAPVEVHSDTGVVTGRVTEVHGDTDLVVGDSIDFHSSRHDADAYLVPFYREPELSGNVGAIFGDQVEFSCGFGDGTPRLLLADVSASWDSATCAQTLVVRDSQANGSICDYPSQGDDGGCSGGQSGSLGLVGLAGLAWVAGRSRRVPAR